MTRTVKLTNRAREDGGSWFIAPEQWPSSPIARSVLRILAECVEAEPCAEWHLETRGDVADWHRMEVSQ